jgi:hypothetical protein
MAVVSMIERLPLELKQDLLAALADLASLRSAALSCPSMYHAFVNAEKLITNQVVNNQIDAAVLPEAVGALKSSRPQPWNQAGRWRLHSSSSPGSDISSTFIDPI